MAQGKPKKTRLDYTGMTFHKWYVIGPAPDYIAPNGVRRRKWICRCECGNVKEIVNFWGKRVSKQCKECADRGFSVSKGCGGIAPGVWTVFRDNATARKLEFTITPEYTWDLFLAQEKKCALSGLPISLPKTRRDRPNTNASLDRIDSSKGYVVGNVQWVDKTVNFMKQSLSTESFLALCRQIVEHNSK